jgi:hypothetical protein
MIPRPALVLGLVVSLISSADAQNFVYPARGQSPAQQKKDETSCYSWAIQQTGFDPANPQPIQAPPPKATTASGVTPGAGLKGAAVGAAGGAAIGAIGGNAGTGAAAGAVGGAIIARSRSRRQNAAQAQADQQAVQAAEQQRMAGFGRARSACLEGRGYTVK